MNKNIINILSWNLKEKINHVADNGLFFNKNYIADRFSNLFGIKDKEVFYNAFELVAYGQGNEIVKINSLQSSSLLSLLVFYSLFRNNHENSINIGGVQYNFSLFENKNKVINLPSCIDVVLWSRESRKLLFLESKFTEYNEIKESQKYGIGYYSLYSELDKKGIFDSEFKISKNEKDNKLEITSINSNKKYIEGIKQSISHLIGILRGPYLNINEIYTQSYLEEYIKIYEQAEEIIYGTILFDPHFIDPDNNIKEINNFDNYYELYSKIIGSNGDIIINEIRKWCDRENLSKYDEKNIKVLPKPITYQELTINSPEYFAKLPKPIKQFYNF